MDLLKSLWLLRSGISVALIEEVRGSSRKDGAVRIRGDGSQAARQDRKETLRYRQNALPFGLEFHKYPVLTDLFRRWERVRITVSTFRQACVSIKSGQYDLVVSADHLPDGTSSALIKCLSSLPVSPLISYAAGDSLFWLPVVLFGVKCWKAGALKGEVFVKFLEQVIAVKTL